jgi:4-amino-4-deoxy-L-arabinose transferase-like glycosyltransferase
MEFLGDQSRDVTIIRDLFLNGNLFFIGPQTSIGNMYLGPWFYYLIAPSLLLANFNPIGPALFIALINIATIFLIYFIAKKWFSSSIGLISALLFAISPVVIKYSNFIWNPNIMPFFALLFIYFFFEGLFNQKYKYFIYASLSFVMVINSHYLGLALLPLPAIYWLVELVKLIKSKSKHLKTFLINTFLAFTAFIFSLIPQILFDIKHQGQNIKALINFFTYRETTVNIKAYKAIPELPSIFNQVTTDLLAGRDLSAGLIISIIFTLLIVLYLFSLYRKKQISKYFLVIFFWYLSGLIALALYKQHIYAHYFAFLFPSAFILIAILVQRFRFIGIPLIILIIYFSLTNNPFRWQPNYQLKTTQEISNSIITSANNQDFNFALLSKMGWGFNYYLTNQKNYYEINEKLTNQLFVVCVPFQTDCNPINNPEYNIAAFGWAKIDSEWEINGIKIFRLLHTQDD